MEGRMTICNMSIEAGARAGMIAPDATTFAYLKGRRFSPQGAAWDEAVAHWSELVTDAGAIFDRELTIHAADITPTVSWGTSPGMVTGVKSTVPLADPNASEADQKAFERALEYMDLKAGTPIEQIAIDRVFLGSCTNGRIEDLRAAAAVVRGYHVATTVRAMVVPGSQHVKEQAEKEGLDKVFTTAGFDWREPGCSMCLGMNPDILAPGERCASTSNRNFEGRQGRGGRTHLVSPQMAAAAAITGHFTDIRNWKFKDRSSAKQRALKSNMQPINVLTSTAAPLDRPNVDTDQIIPKQFLKRIERTGYGEFLFFDWRRIQEGPDAGKPDPDFVLNKPQYKGAKILIAGKNFGCGSSREHAAWALDDFGFIAVIAPSFADIFYSNAGKNGMILVRLSEADVQTLLRPLRRKTRTTRSPSTSKPRPSSTIRASAPNSRSTPSANTAS